MPVSAPVPSSSSSTVAWNVVAVPSPRLAAQTDTAEPPSISRRGRSRRPRRSRSGRPGASTSWIASSAASGADEDRARDEDDREVARRAAELRRAPPTPPRAPPCGRSGDGREAGSDADGHDGCDDTGRAAGSHTGSPCPRSSPSSGPPGVGKTAVAIALAERLRARGEDPVAVSADALQVYAGLPILTGAASEHEQAPAGAPPARLRADRRDLLRRAPTPSAPTRDRRAARGRTGGRSSSAAPASTCAPRWPSSTSGRPSTPRSAPLGARPRAARRAPRAAARHRSQRDRARPTASASSARYELIDAGHEPPPPAHAPSSCGPRTPAIPTLLAALTMDRERALRAHRRPHRRDGRGRRRARRCSRPHAARRLRHGAQGARLPGAARRRRRGHEDEDPPLRQAPAHVAAQAARTPTRST